MSVMEIIIIAGHGSSSKESGGIADVASSLHTMIHPKCNKDCVRVGYLQFSKPSIRDAIKKAVKDCATKIIIHPYFLSRGIHVTKSIPAIINKAKALYPEVKFLYTEPLGPDDGLAEIVLKKIRAAKEDE
jgi:sirohydrochlorin ferrochelatase